MPTLAHPGALLIFPAALLLLIVFRFLRARRVTVNVGSLLIWKRLSALNVAPPKKKFVFDAALLLQALTLLAVCGALTFPALLSAAPSGREFLLLIDNGPLSRARQHDAPGLDALLSAARNTLSQLSADDRVQLARSAPFPLMLNKAPLDKSAASALLEKISPALSGPTADELCTFALDRARTLNRGAPLPALVFSLSQQLGKASADARAMLWNTPDIKSDFNNVGIVEAGSSVNALDGPNGRRVLVRLKNFCSDAVTGTVEFATIDSTTITPLKREPLTLAPGASAAIGFKVPAQINLALWVKWERDAGGDVMFDDDTVTFFPRNRRAPHIRFHSPLPALERLFANALDADLDTGDADYSRGTPDLDVYVRALPENIPAAAQAALFVAPSHGYHGYFDVGPTEVAWPRAERGDNDPLNADIPPGDAGIAIPKAFEFLQTGDFKALLRNAATGRALALKFSDEKSRPCYVLAFTPGAGLAAERLLDPALAALLTRLANEAAHSGAPYTLTKAAEFEAQSGEPVPLEWTFAGPLPKPFSGVLDERASDLRAAAGVANPAGTRVTLDEFLHPAPAVAASWLDFLPWLALLGGLFALAELLCRLRN